MDAANPNRPAGAPDGALVFDQTPSEHIQLASEDEAREPRTPSQRLLLEDYRRGLETELTLFAEDLLTVRTTRAGRGEQLRHLDLRYLDPEPEITTRLATVAFRIAAALAAVAALGVLAAWAGLGAFSPLAWGAAAGAGALLTGLVGLYRSRRDHVFRTLHGRATVLTLTAPCGAFGRYAAAVTQLREAIGKANTAGSKDERVRLKGEMREHYRLEHSGIISADDCARGTARILEQFDRAGTR